MTEYEPRMGGYGADCFHCHGGPLFTDHQFRHNGLAAKSGGDAGRQRIMGAERDRGSFATPSLRNVALTSNLAKHPETVRELSTKDQRALVALLESFPDERFRSQPSASPQTQTP